MFDKTVTVFNYYESPTARLWYPHVLFGVHLETDRAQIIRKYGPESKDNAVLHIPLMNEDGERKILDFSAELTLWKPPKEWRKLSSDEMETCITFNPEKDFFYWGEWTEGVVNDDQYANPRGDGDFYSYMNGNKDFVYKITSVEGPYNLIPHFEVMGA